MLIYIYMNYTLKEQMSWSYKYVCLIHMQKYISLNLTEGVRYKVGLICVSEFLRYCTFLNFKTSMQKYSIK